MEIRARNALPFMLITLVLGILFGLILGWQVWPVTWYNTDPSDLRVEHQKDYVLMAAQSYAQTGNAEQTRLWIGELQDDDTTWEQVANLVERVAREHEANGDIGGAILVRRMASALQMPQATAAQFEEPKYFVRFSDRPLLLPVAALALVLLLGLAAWMLLTRYRDITLTARSSPTRPAIQTHTEATTTVSTDSMPAYENPSSVRPSTVIQQTTQQTRVIEKQQPEIDNADLGDSYTARRVVTEMRPPEATPTEMPEQVPETSLDLDQDLEDMEEELALPPSHPSTRASELPPDALGIWQADYAYGNDDFDCNFTIETADHEFLGECGVGATDYITGEGPQKVQAFEVWLFDKGDIRTVRQILVSEYAFNDTTFNARMAEKGDVIMVQPGAIIALETQSLAVTATVQEFSYVPDEEKPSTYFERLVVELIAERNDQLV